MTKTLDKIEYAVGDSYIVPIMYGDYTGLDDDEIKTLENFLAGIDHMVKEKYRVAHPPLGNSRTAER